MTKVCLFVDNELKETKCYLTKRGAKNAVKKTIVRLSSQGWTMSEIAKEVWRCENYFRRNNYIIIL